MARETILIVDDSPQIVNTLRAILEASKYTVVSVADGQAGLETAVRINPDLIMLDLNMPRMTGLQMLTALRQTACQAPVIFMTVYGSEQVAIEAFRLGIRDYLTKPFTAEEAEQAVDKALRESRLERERAELTRNLLAAETVRKTTVTLSHYINNDLMVLMYCLNMLGEGIKKKQIDANLLTLLQKGNASLKHIHAVMKILSQITEVRQTTYSRDISMVDIEAALKKELGETG